MADSFSVKAILSASDSGFSSTLKSCSGTLDSINSKINGFSFGILTGAGQAAFNGLTSAARNLVGAIDASNVSWKTFEGNMGILGKTSKEISKVKDDLQEFAQQTVYSSSDMATTYAQLEAVGVKNCSSLVKSFGGLAAASENPQQAMKTLSQQATQMAAKPKVAWQDFKLMLEQTPAGISAVAKEMGMSTSDMVTAVQEGKLSTDKFFEAIIKAGGAGTKFEKMATEFKTIGQATDGLMDALAYNLTPAFEVLTQKGIAGLNKLSDMFSSIDMSVATKGIEKVSSAFSKFSSTVFGDVSSKDIASKIEVGIDKAFTAVSNFITKVAPYAKAVKDTFGDIKTSIQPAVDAIKTSFTELTGGFGGTSDVDNFKGVLQSVADVIKKVADFATEHSDAIAKLIKYLPAIAIGLKGFSIAKAVAPGVISFAGGIAKMASSIGSGIATKLFGVASGQKAVGDASATTGNDMLKAAGAFLMMGVGVLMIAVGFGILAQAAIALASAGGGAIAVMAGMVIVLALIGIGLAVLLKTLAPMSGQLIAVAASFLILGVAVVLIAAGLAIMAISSIALANAGWGAIGVMLGMIVAIALLAVVIATVGTAMIAGAVGFLIFGAAVLLVGAGFMLLGVGALLAATSLQMIVAVLPMLCAFGVQGALALGALSLAMGAFAIGAGLAGVAALILGAGLLVCAAAVLLLGAGVLVLSVAMIVASGALALMNLLLPALAANGMQGAMAIMALGAALLIFGVGALMAGTGLIVLGAGLVVATIAIAAFGIGATACAVGVGILAVALKSVKSSLKSIASNAKTTQKSLKSMNKSVDAVTSGLDAIGNKAKTAMKKLTSAFDDTKKKAQEAGKAVGTGFTSGMQSSLAKSSVVAMTASVSVSMALNAGRANAYSAGAYIGIGFAQGMLSQLAIVRSAATQLAEQADKAVRAKAQIKSPSRVADKLGSYWGEGLANGIVGMAKDVWNAAQELVAIPNVATPNLAYAYAGELSSDYEYTRKHEYNITVISEMDGKKVGEGCATYVSNKIDKEQTRAARKHGKA